MVKLFVSSAALALLALAASPTAAQAWRVHPCDYARPDDVSQYALLDDLGETPRLTLLPEAAAREAFPSASLTLWPNPAHEVVHAELTAASAGPTTLYLYDALGHLVRTQAINPGAAGAAIRLSDLPAGIYMLRARTTTRRLVVE